MAHTWRFVDSIASSPGARLDINSLANGIFITEQPTISPPQLRRVYASSMMADGARIPAAAFENRVLRLPLQIMRSTADLQATLLQSLARELSRQPITPGEPGNIIQVNMGNTRPMFFRTFPAPDLLYEFAMRLPMQGKVTLEIPCEPFGYGLEQVETPVVVSNNPASANGMFLDVASVQGDVETPLHLTFGNTVVATGRRMSAIAVRRRGTVGSMPFLLQAEAMTQGTDTATVANSGTFSGSPGNNYSKYTPVTAPTVFAQRLSIAKFPATASIDARGSYRVFIRVRQNTAADVWEMRLLWGSADNSYTNDTALLPADTGPSAPTVKLIDLGLIQVPAGVDPVGRGLSGVELVTEGVLLSVQARRVSGSGTLDMDYLLTVPTDDRGITYVLWPENATVTDFVMEGAPGPKVYARNASGQITSTQAAEPYGTGLMLTPGRTNRVIYVRDVGRGTALTGAGDTFSTTTTITASYFPRYLFPLRPATT